ncbi:MAG: agmatinase [SAR324 cluster bacterium]|nr:agmatinase [SAR324 cluster bacterium]
MTGNEHFIADLSMYANNYSFLGRPLSRELGDAVDVVVMGIPYDLATTGRSGARMGPNGIRQASTNLRWETTRWPWTFSLFDRLSVNDYGDLEFRPGDSHDMMKIVAAECTKILSAGKALLSFGGDHFVTLPLLRGFNIHHGPLALIHFDAHTDTDSKGGPFDHGTMFFPAIEERLIDPFKSIQIGIRTQYNYEMHPFKVIDGAAANDLAVEEIIALVYQCVGDSPAYISFDIDCLDPAYAPGTGTPVAGGITTDRALKLIRGLQDLNLVGMDLVEVAPPYDHSDITSLAGATLALEFLYCLAAK